MALNIAPASDIDELNQIKPVSLSSYFPPGTTYFYGYPAGEDSGFLNNVPPEVEELVASRALSCAGNDLKVISFAATSPQVLDRSLRRAFSIPDIAEFQQIILPRNIDISLKGEARNKAIKNFLCANVTPRSLIMAQPYVDGELEDLYQIPVKVTTWLNDKHNMCDFIDKRFMPKRLAVYQNGSEFVTGHQSLELPYVVKATSSSAGDGVYICLTDNILQAALKDLGTLSGTILVEEYIEAKRNIGIHFGVYADPAKPADYLGINDQLTSDSGEFVGGVISSGNFPKELNEIRNHLMHELLPRVRQMGWYGVGCFDILLDQHGDPYFIDGNFRMTGMTAYHFLVANAIIKTPLLAFNGSFMGSRQELEAKLLPYARTENQILQLVALSCHGDHWKFNAALFFENDSQLRQQIDQLQQTGVKSAALDIIAQNPS